MKTIMVLAGMLVSVNLMAADIYEFKREPQVQPAPVKVVSQPAPKPVKKPAQTTAAKKTPAAAQATAQDAVAQTQPCAQGAPCNDH